VTLNNSGVLAITAGNGVSVSGTQANITINAIAAGTVTNVSAVGQNGIGAVVTTPNTTPVITLNLGAITPSSVTTSGLETVGSLRTSNLTGYLYGNGSSNVTASTTIPAANVTGLATVATTGNYNDLIGKPTLNAGTVTSVATTGSVNGITLTGGTITSSGTITLGGTLSGISNSQLTNNSITVTAGTGLSGGGTVALGGAITLNATNTGTVSSVSVSPNSGVTAGVTNSTTTPTISIGLGAITPTSVTTNTMTFGVNTGVLTVSTGIVGSAAITGSGQAVFNSGPSIAAPTITGAATAVNLTTSGLESVANLKTTGLTGYLYGNSTTNVTASTTIPTSSLSGSVSLTSQVSGILPIANGGTGSSTASLVAGTGIAITGTFPNQTINATGGTGTVTSVSGAGSVNGITLTGTVTTSGSLTLGGTLGSITNSQLTNNSITIAGTSTALGGSISQDTITGLSTTGIVKRTGANTLAIATSGSDYAPATSTTNILYGNGSGGFSPVTVGSGLSFTAGTLASTSAGGSVTNVSVTPNSGVLAGVTNPSTTPAISIGLGNITPLSVTSNAGSFTTLNSSGQTLLATGGGNVGIGVTPAAWNAGGFTALELTNGTALWSTTSSSATPSTWLSNNLYYTGSFYYKNNAAAGGYVQSDGYHHWYTAPTGTAGAGATLTEQMYLTSGGLKVVNTTSSSSTSTGALVVGNGSSGGLGVGGNINAGGTINQWSGLSSSMSSYANFNANNNSSATSFIGGVLVYGSSGYYYGMDLGYNSSTSRSRTRLFANNTSDVAFSFSGTNPSSQSALTDAVTIRGDSGNVGIGTASPAYPLDVNGALHASGNGEFSGTEVSLNAIGTARFQWYNSGNYLNWIECGGVAGNNYMRFATGNSEAMRIDSSGNVGINTTSPTSLLTVNGNIGMFAGDGILSNLYYNGSFKYMANGYGFLQFNNGSNWAWFATYANNTSGAGASAGPSEVMDLTNAGTLLLNATTSSSSTTSGALQVAGGVGIQGTLYAGGGSAGNGIVSIPSTSGGYCYIANAPNNSGTYYMIAFQAASTNVGAIYSSSSTTTYATTSDKRLKTPLRSWSLGDRFDELPIGEFNWLKDGSVGHGTLAQDLMKVYPDAVAKGDDKDVSKPYMVDYGKLTVPLIAEVKTLRSRVKTLESEQAEMMQAIKDLQQQVKQLSKQP
jgi:hypothetical protein